ncbi:hypothetical protein KKA47_02770, partial [bacterium]|nr:hypothetical protein [bacterium]
EGITKKELKIVKESFINSLVMNYRDSESVVDMRATIDYLGYPEDYIDQMLKAVIDLDVKTVNEVAKKYIHPDNLVYVFVGDSVKFKDRLTEFGKVTELNLNN